MDTKSAPHSPRRSLLFTPGDSIRKMRKAARVGADMVILDLEDAVAPAQKTEARQQVETALSSVDFGPTEVLVRVNSPNSGLIAADLGAVASAGAEGILVPKVERAEELARVEYLLTDVELAANRPAGAIRLYALIETALAIMNLKEICQASARLDGLMLGAEDLAADLGAIRTKEGREVLFGRSVLVTAAAAYGLQAIDMVYLDLDDLAGLEQECELGVQLGFSGKMAIHPRQIDTINKVFSPPPSEIEKAKRLVEAFRKHQAAGSGVFALDGRMVDKPIILAAERLLQRARLAGLIEA